MTTAVVESPGNDRVLASLSLDTIVVGHGSAPEVDTAVLEMDVAIRSASPLHGGDQSEGRPGSLVARWVPDPRAGSGLICTWVPRSGTETWVSFDA